jgi:hypothetical protein
MITEYKKYKIFKNTKNTKDLKWFKLLCRLKDYGMEISY